MAVYLIADIKVTDDAWIPDYATNVHDIVNKHGGNAFPAVAILQPLKARD